jgi:ribonucleoside-diphosphate reductase beta chain
MNKRKAVNWDRKNDDFTQMFFEQNVRQFWLDTEIPVSKDSKSWKSLNEHEKDVYKKALAGLTLLDTEQGNIGMPSIMNKVDDFQRKAVLSFMATMEMIHAKSYSTIFTTLIEKHEIDELFDWVEDNKYLQLKSNKIVRYYENIKSKKDLYMAMVASVFLESFLFYSSFFYPLYLAGQGKMVNSGEIINLILRDEAIHGIYVGLLAQEVYHKLSPIKKDEVDKETIELLNELMDNEIHYTDEVYGSINFHQEVKKFLRYNANKALMNLGKESHYEEEEINPIVLNGLKTETKTHDFFSVKGNGYQKGKVEPLIDDDFRF